MGAAAIAYTVWTKHLKINPANPEWADRDRFVFPGPRLHAFIQFVAPDRFDLSLDDLKNFRQWGSRTPGHPEFGMTPVSKLPRDRSDRVRERRRMAIAEAHLRLNSTNRMPRL
jgi:transketolase